MSLNGSSLGEFALGEIAAASTSASGVINATLDGVSANIAGTYEAPSSGTGTIDATLDGVSADMIGVIEVPIAAAVLQNIDGTPLSNLTGINYSVYDSPPGARGSEVAHTEVIGATTDVSGNITFDCRNTSLSVGQDVYIELINGDAPPRIMLLKLANSIGEP